MAFGILIPVSRSEGNVNVTHSASHDGDPVENSEYGAEVSAVIIGIQFPPNRGNNLIERLSVADKKTIDIVTEERKPLIQDGLNIIGIPFVLRAELRELIDENHRLLRQTPLEDHVLTGKTVTETLATQLDRDVGIEAWLLIESQLLILIAELVFERTPPAGQTPTGMDTPKITFRELNAIQSFTRSETTAEANSGIIIDGCRLNELLPNDKEKNCRAEQNQKQSANLKTTFYRFCSPYPLST